MKRKKSKISILLKFWAEDGNTQILHKIVRLFEKLPTKTRILDNTSSK